MSARGRRSASSASSAARQRRVADRVDLRRDPGVGGPRGEARRGLRRREPDAALRAGAAAGPPPRRSARAAPPSASRACRRRTASASRIGPARPARPSGSPLRSSGSAAAASCSDGRGVDPDRQLAALGELAVRRDRPAEARPGRQRARVVDARRRRARTSSCAEPRIAPRTSRRSAAGRGPSRAGPRSRAGRRSARPSRRGG